MERMPKFEQSPKGEKAAEVVELADWRAARDTAQEYVAERAPGILESEASPEKINVLTLLLKEFESTMNDEEVTPAAQRQAYYASEIVARVLSETELVLSEEQVLRRQERASIPAQPPVDYRGVAQVVSFDRLRPLSPRNDNRPPTPALAMARS